MKHDWKYIILLRYRYSNLKLVVTVRIKYVGSNKKTDRLTRNMKYRKKEIQKSMYSISVKKMYYFNCTFLKKLVISRECHFTMSHYGSILIH